MDRIDGPGPTVPRVGDQPDERRGFTSRDALPEGGYQAGGLGPRFGEACRRRVIRLQVIEDDLLGGDELLADMGDVAGDIVGNDGDAVAVTVQEIPREDGDPADVNGAPEIDHVVVPVGGDGAVGEGGKTEFAHLVEVAAGAACDQADGAEGLVGGAHHLAEGRRHRRAVEVLEDDHRRSGDLRERGHLPVHGGIDVPLRRGGGAHRHGAGVPDHGGHLRVACLDAGVGVAGVPGPDLEQLDGVADGRGIELAQQLEVLAAQSCFRHSILSGGSGAGKISRSSRGCQSCFRGGRTCLQTGFALPISG